jgi:DNA-binding NarL/FixJ family response regulator
MNDNSQSNQIKVSVVEDSVDFCRTLEMMINGTTGLTCLSAHFNAESALERIPKNLPDIVLIDLGLPKMTGTECILNLKSRFPNLQFLVLTIKDQDEEVFGALKAGASGYLLKSSSPTEIIESIKELYDGGAPMSADIARKVVSHFQKTSIPESPYEHLLTNREKEVLGLLSLGKYYKEIAAELYVSMETVKTHCHHIYEKLHVSSRTEALNKYYNR